MATSKVISWFRSPAEQALYESLLDEQVKLFGYDVYYLPRESVRDDDLFGEDVLNKFPHAIPIEAYVENIEGFGGQGEVFAKFGIEIDDQITFIVTRKRFEEVRKSNLLDEDGYPLLDETAENEIVPGDQPKILDETQDYDYSAQPRPNEADLIYFPLVGKLFEIRFVEHEKLFYTLGRRMIYSLKCEMYQSSSERIDTGIPEIDQVEVVTSTNILDNKILAEDGTAILSEDGDFLISESYRVENIEPQANNELFNRDVTGIADFSELNPFVSGIRY